MRVFKNGINRPDRFESMKDYSLTDRQEKLLSAALEDVLDSKAALFQRTMRLQYWVKRIWDEGKKEGKKEGNHE
jgi:hypothetical protein